MLPDEDMPQLSDTKTASDVAAAFSSTQKRMPASRRT